jgi:hypothetical protein
MSGVVALMYAVGFLCSKSHFNMLGIRLYSGVAAGDYVEIGAKFFYITLIIFFESLIDLGRTIIPVMVILSILIMVIIAGTSAFIARVRRTGIRDILRQSYVILRKGKPDAKPAQVFWFFFRLWC